MTSSSSAPSSTSRCPRVRLTSWRPDEKVDYDAIAKYHEMRNATLKFVTDTRPLEKSDATKAIERYSEALARAREYKHFAADRRLFPLIEPGCNGNEVGILDRHKARSK